MFDKIRKNFGYCCMRLPMQGKEVDYAEFNKMIDAFLDNGLTISSRRPGGKPTILKCGMRTSRKTNGIFIRLTARESAMKSCRSAGQSIAIKTPAI